MLNKIILFIILFPFLLSAQNFGYKDYWKNRKPYSDYWQQDVHYTIQATINDSLDEIKGKEHLTYYNNSPHALTEVYFHLYQNAFQPGSYAQCLNEANHAKIKFGKYEAKKMGTVIDQLLIENTPATYSIDNTILKIKLTTPLKSGEKLNFDISFRTYWDQGSMRRRFKKFSVEEKYKHFDGVHWYPRICVYDKKRGWNVDQHLGKEFYGDYGIYDVELTFPSNYIVEATGSLQNESEVLPQTLKNAIAISNYATPNYKYTIPRQGTKTWKFYAENVHDFAFTADPTYRREVVTWNGIQCIALAREENAPYWLPTAQFVANVVKIYSTDFGMYGYPKIVAADANDGMEYPMITLNGGNWPGHRYVIAHEVGHNWFFGMIGNNETYRAFLDEGFTQFLTSWSMKRTIPNANYNAIDEQVVYNGYLSDAINRSDMPLNTHSDDFNSALGHGGGYRHVYYKTATMLYNLHYFNKWKFAHPYPEDFRDAITEYVKTDLSWFFDQWMETTKVIDYQIAKIKKLKKKDGLYRYAITLKRNGEMQMPLDLEILDKSGKKYRYLVPNTYFAKQEGQIPLKPWIGWGILNSTHRDTITLENKLNKVIIDPSNRLADINRIDNIKSKSQYKLPLHTSLNTGVQPAFTLNKQYLLLRPDIWFNAVDGIKAGFNIHYDYARIKHSLDASVWYNTGFGAEMPYPEFVRPKLNYSLQLSEWVGRDAYIYLISRYLDGATLNDFGFKKSFKTYQFNLHHKTIGLNRNGYHYWLTPNDYKIRDDKFNNSLIAEIKHNYNYKNGEGNIKMGLRGSTFGPYYGYGSMDIEAINHIRVSKFEIRTRWYLSRISGNNVPEEVMLNLAGANMEQMLESKFTRSRGWIPENWLGYGNTINHFQQSGGLNLRGYAGYLAPNSLMAGNPYLYQGSYGSSISVEVDFDRFIPLRPKFTRNWLRTDLYLFADAGILKNNLGYSYFEVIPYHVPLRADAGIGAALNITRWGKRNLISPFTLRFDMPLFLNKPPYIDKGYIAQRWVVGIGRSF